MSFRTGLFTGIAVTLLAGGAGGVAWWIITTPKAVAKPTKPEPAATVDHKIKEEELNNIKLTPKGDKALEVDHGKNVITLTPKAGKALQVEVGKVERKQVSQDRIYAGEIAVPAGQTILVSAPLGGLLQAPKEGVPQPGRTVKKGQPIVQLSPLLTPEARTSLATASVDAAGQVDSARATLQGAETNLNRSKMLVKSGAGIQRELDNFQVQYDVAHKTLEAAEARLTLLNRMTAEIEKGTAPPITLEAPVEGLLRNISALPGQNVPAGQTLFEIVVLTRAWIRVPVYVGDLGEIASAEQVSVGSLASRPGPSPRSARPITAPPTANPIAGTVDLYYEIDNRAGDLLPGQRVAVKVPLHSESESLVVPWSAVIHDINGGTWVYQKLDGDLRFNRKRVVVRRVNGDLAVLDSGPPPDTIVVTKGAIELYGVETGFSK